MFIRKHFDHMAKTGQNLRNRQSGRGSLAQLSSSVLWNFSESYTFSHPFLPLLPPPFPNDKIALFLDTEYMSKIFIKLVSEVALWRAGSAPPPPRPNFWKKKMGSDIQTDDDTTNESRGYEKVCYSHDEALRKEQEQVSKLVWNDLSEGNSDWLWFLLWLGWGQRKVSMYRLGFAWFELPVQYQGKGCTHFLFSLPRCEAKGREKGRGWKSSVVKHQKWRQTLYSS